MSINFSAYYKYSKPHISKSKEINTQNELKQNTSESNNKDNLDLEDTNNKEKSCYINIKNSSKDD